MSFLFKASGDNGLARRKGCSGRPKTVRTHENINLFDELVLRQEDTTVLQYCNLITSYAVFY